MPSVSLSYAFFMQHEKILSWKNKPILLIHFSKMSLKSSHEYLQNVVDKVNFSIFTQNHYTHIWSCSGSMSRAWPGLLPLPSNSMGNHRGSTFNRHQTWVLFLAHLQPPPDWPSSMSCFEHRSGFFTAHPLQPAPPQSEHL